MWSVYADVTGRRVFTFMTGLLTAVTVSVLASPCPSAASAANSSGPVVRSGPVSLAGCDGAKLQGQARVAQVAFTIGQPVRIKMVVRNVGQTTCRFAGYDRTRTQEIGPCGSVSLVVRNAAGVDVFPGNLEYNCPLEVYLSLRPGKSFRANGTWLQNTATEGLAPRGRYHLVLGGRLVVPVVLD